MNISVWIEGRTFNSGVGAYRIGINKDFGTIGA